METLQAVNSPFWRAASAILLGIATVCVNKLIGFATNQIAGDSGSSAKRPSLDHLVRKGHPVYVSPMYMDHYYHDY